MRCRQSPWLLLVLALPGCATVPPRQTRLMSEATELTASTEELRIMVRDLARPFAGMIAEAADEIAATSGDPELRLAAVRWKTTAIPAMQEALFRRDPLAAALDAGLLLAQMRLFFDETLAPQLEPEQLAVADRVLGRMRADLERVLVAAGGDPARAPETWELLERWAREDPIGASFASRRTSQARLAQLTARSGTGGALGAVASLEEDLDDLAGRLDVYVASLPSVARWQAELLLLEALAERGPIARALDGMPPIPLDIAGLPFDLAAEREALVAAASAEREATQAWAASEILALRRLASAERRAVLEAVTAERQAILAGVTAERQAVLEGAIAGLRREREEAFEHLGRIVERSLVNARNEVVDHFMDRLAKLVAASLVGGLLGAILLMLLWRRLMA